MAGKRKRITFVETEGGCHVCTSHYINKDGYPCVHKDGRNQNLHRVLFEEKNGPLPEDHVVRHKCDNRPCINLEHLEGGTPAQNTQDCVERGRLNTPTRESGRSDAKLSSPQLEEIRARYKLEDITQEQLGKQYDVRGSTVSKIVNFVGKYKRKD